MKKCTILIAIYSLFQVLTLEQLPAQEYLYTMGTANVESGFASYVDSSDSTLTVVGYSENSGFGKADAIVSHYKLGTSFPYLHLQWSRIIGKAQDDHAYSIQKDITGNYIICGKCTKPTTMDADLLLVRIDKKGKVKYAKTFDINNAIQDDVAQRVIVGHSQLAIIVGTTRSVDPDGDILVAAVDTLGKQRWGYIFGKPNSVEAGYSIIMDSQQHYVVLGSTGIGQSLNIALLKADTFGNLLASVELGAVDAAGAELHADFGYDLVDSPNQNAYVITGGTRSFGISTKVDLLLLSIDRALNTINWNTILTSSVLFDSTESDVGRAIIRNIDDKYVIAGKTESMSVNPLVEDMLLAKFNTMGALTGAGRPHSALEMTDNDLANDLDHVNIPGFPHGYLATGSTASAGLGLRDVLLASFNETDTCCYESISFNSESVLFATKHFVMPDSVELTPDSLQVKSVNLDTTIICYGCALTPTHIDQRSIRPDDFRVSQNFPNPFNPSTEIQYSIPLAANVHIIVFNTLGKKVRTLVDDHQEPGQHRIIWNGQDDSGYQVSSGVYLFRVRVGDFYEMKKMIMIK